MQNKTLPILRSWTSHAGSVSNEKAPDFPLTSYPGYYEQQEIRNGPSLYNIIMNVLI